jgi:hypothetical protein
VVAVDKCEKEPETHPGVKVECVTEGLDQSFETLPPVSIESESASEVSADSAKLLTELNAHGLASTYHFEYLTQAEFEADADSFEGPDRPEAVPAPDGEAGEGTEAVGFSIAIQHLEPHTTYHYRVAARNTLNEPGKYVYGADRTFTTQGAEPATLPDGRAWEMVTPPKKHGGSLEPIGEEGGTIQAAADGSGLAYVATAPVDEDPQGNRSVVRSELLATRGAAGVWSTEDITTPHQGVAGVFLGHLSEYKLFSADLSRAAVEPFGATPLAPTPSEPAEPNAERTPYLREPGGSFTPLVYAGNVPPGTRFGGEEVHPEEFQNGVEFVTGTPDLSHVLVQSPSSLVAGFENEGRQSIYEWSEGKPVLEPISVLPSGVAAGAAKVGNGNLQVRNAISSDGSRVFFSSGSELFMRDMVLGAAGKTLRIDAPQAGVKEGSASAVFQFASADGSKVFFTDQARLTTNATAKQNQPDLYECQIEVTGEELSCALKDLSVDSHANEAANVNAGEGAVLGGGKDGGHVYFVTSGALGEGEEARSGNCPNAGEGKCANLYEYDTQSEAPQPRLVAVLSGEDRPDWGGSVNGSNGNNLSEMTARVSPDGRYLAFMSKRSLTGYDNRDAKSGVPDQEVYEFDSQTGRLACASCDPSGQPPVGEFDEGVFPGLLVDAPRLWAGQTLAGSIPGWTSVDVQHALYQSRYLSDSGRLFFNSPVGLVPGDSNGTQDVYEYEPDAVGSCASAPACIGLISSGSSSEESAFLDASEGDREGEHGEAGSEAGDDVFFLTAAQLSKEDTDTALDIYDAHVCSAAAPCASPAPGAPSPCATSDACRAAPTPQPGIFGAPASQTFSGPGNPAPPRSAVVKSVVKPKTLTRAQKLAKALKVCAKDKQKSKRAKCQKQAKQKYGASKAKKSAHTNRRPSR